VHVGVHHRSVGIRVAVLEQHGVVGDARSQVHIKMLPQIVPGDLGAVVGVEDHLGPVLDGEEVARGLADMGSVGQEVDGAVAELRLQLEGEEDGALEIPPGGRVRIPDGEELPALDARERCQRRGGRGRDGDDDPALGPERCERGVRRDRERRDLGPGNVGVGQLGGPARVGGGAVEAEQRSGVGGRAAEEEDGGGGGDREEEEQQLGGVLRGPDGEVQVLGEGPRVSAVRPWRAARGRGRLAAPAPCDGGVRGRAVLDEHVLLPLGLGGVERIWARGLVSVGGRRQIWGGCTAGQCGGRRQTARRGRAGDRYRGGVGRRNRRRGFEAPAWRVSVVNGEWSVRYSNKRESPPRRGRLARLEVLDAAVVGSRISLFPNYFSVHLSEKKNETSWTLDRQSIIERSLHCRLHVQIGVWSTILQISLDLDVGLL
jgi:hypothetical protein